MCSPPSVGKQSQAKGLDTGPSACHLPASLRSSDAIWGAVSEHRGCRGGGDGGCCRPLPRGQGTMAWLRAARGRGEDREVPKANPLALETAGCQDGGQLGLKDEPQFLAMKLGCRGRGA